MATLVFQAAGAALGSVFGPVGAIAGRALGALAGNMLDQALFSTPTTPTGRLSNARIAGPEEGTAIARVYGTVRIGGTLIWATRFLESVVVERQGGKGGGGRRSETYSYSANLALGLCEGPIAAVRRVFADGRELDLSTVTMRFYRGTADQAPDPLILARQGAGRTPAFRGLAYVVFENLPLGPYGNRIPLLQFEVVRPVGALERQIRAVTIIPGATEHGYNPAPVSEHLGGGAARVLNRNTFTGETDWAASLDELQALCPNLKAVALVTSWFGTDLRVGECRSLPGVETASRSGESSPWSVGAYRRGTARLVSRVNGGPAYGGTPSDESVIAAIRDLKARGLKVFLYPFLMMDIAAGNGLPDPYGGAEQAAYPWRGRITCHPAPGRPGSPDGTAAITAMVDRFFGGDTGFDRLILHHAALAKAAGGVDGMILGSELRGITTLRDGPGSYPAVARLVALAAAVRAELGASTALTYGADWSEYFGHQPGDGTGDVHFHLDPLWASPHVDAVGIDNYLPLADFRDGDLLAANRDGFRHQEDPDALERGITSGERFQWYYASAADRAAGRRSPISDGAAGKPWVFAPKDIAGWWANRHFNRPGGRESQTPTAWQPGMKPIWFTELGCPAVDRGANEPNLFIDPKSTESALPGFSAGFRADSHQRRFLEAHHRYWQGIKPPTGMVAPERLFVWCWDARPYPAFPNRADLWADGGNWQRGHWLNGRLGSGTVADVLAAILADHGFFDADLSGVTGDLFGYVQGEIASARQMIEPILSAFQIDLFERDGRLVFTSRAEASRTPLVLDVLADVEGEPLYRRTRASRADQPGSVRISHDDPALNFEPAIAASRAIPGAEGKVQLFHLTGSVEAETAARLAEALLRDGQLQGDELHFRLSPTDLRLQPGDPVRLADGPEGDFLVTRVEEHAERRITARAYAPGRGAGARRLSPIRTPPREPAALFAPDVLFLDLPMMGETAPEAAARVAVLSKPWRSVVISSLSGTDNARRRVIVDRPARIGTLAASLAPSGVLGRFDGSREILVDMAFGALSTAERRDVLAGANRVAVVAEDGSLEVIGFLSAEEVARGRFRLTGLLNGLYGTDDRMEAGFETGARLIVLDEAVVPLGLKADEMGRTLSFLAETAEGEKAGPYAFQASRAGRALSPVHVRLSRGEGNAPLLTFIRRGRLDADDWLAREIAEDEPEPHFQAEILDEATGRRWIRSGTSTTLSYLAAGEAIAPPLTGRVQITVMQQNRKFQQGIARQARLLLR